MAKHKHRGAIVAENRRLKAAIATIHDHLHRGDVDAAHEACECAMGGAETSQPSLTATNTARVQDFASRFNALCQELEAVACAITAVPVNDGAHGQMSLQLCGHVELCRLVETSMRGSSSLYMGDHENRGSRG